MVSSVFRIRVALNVDPDPDPGFSITFEVKFHSSSSVCKIYIFLLSYLLIFENFTYIVT